MILDEALSTLEMRAVEMNAVYLGMSRLLMMENAGRAVANQIMSSFGLEKSVIILCGGGGNGGDGFVVARHLSDMGYKIKVVLIGKGDEISSGEALANWKIIKKMKNSIKIQEIRDSKDLEEIHHDIIVDALVGTRLRGALRSKYKDAVKRINESEAYKISVDVPSGLITDIGETKGETVQADLTITFHKAKIGFKNNPPQLGELKVKKIGIPPEAELYVGPGDVSIVHPYRPKDAHKGMFGRLLTIGGSETYSGAPALTAMGGYAVGIDLVYIAVPETAAKTVAGFSPSMITIELPGERLSIDNLEKLVPFIEKIDAVALGPGLNLHSDTVEAVIALCKKIEKMNIPLLLDADGLKAFSKNKWRLKNPVIFTPHSREFEILTNKTPKGTIEEKGNIVKKEAKRLNNVILLKGPVDIISNGSYIRYNYTGNPGMTVGGTGDVLSGIASGYLAMGNQPFESAVAATFINGVTGDRIFKEKGYHILPEDLIKHIPYVIEDAIKEKLDNN